jgi:hypothetical protein
VARSRSTSAFAAANAASCTECPGRPGTEAASAPCSATRHTLTTVDRSTPYRSADSRCLAYPVTIDIHISYFSLGDSRQRSFLPDTVETDIINSLQIGQTPRSIARYFKPDLVHELRRKTTPRRADACAHHACSR